MINVAVVQMEGLVELHNSIMYYLVVVLFAVGWILFSIVYNFISTKTAFSHKFLIHGIFLVCLLQSFLGLFEVFFINYLSYPNLTNSVLLGTYVSNSKNVIGVRNYCTNSAPPVKIEDFYEWLCGLTDGEGSFYILIRDDTKNCQFYFQINLHMDDDKMLHFIHKTLGIGKIQYSAKTVFFTVTRLKEVEKIIDIFSKHPLRSSKLLNFLDFKKAFELYISSKKKSEEIVKEIYTIKNSMNTQRTDFSEPILGKAIITPYWLLGFVEGEGSFFVRQELYKLTFTLSQSSKDLVLMGLIKDFLYNLPGVDRQNMNKTSIRITQNKGSNLKFPMIRLIITKIDFIQHVIIPFFSSLTWRSKKELDFQDWVSVFKIKEKGLSYKEEGKRIINLIISQMNNKRLSTNPSFSKVDRVQLYTEINKLLNGPSNFEVKADGRLFIKSLNSYYTGGGNTQVEIKDKKGLVVNTFFSLSDCARYLGVSQPTVKNRLTKNQSFLLDSKWVYINKVTKENQLTVQTSSRATAQLAAEPKKLENSPLVASKDILNEGEIKDRSVHGLINSSSKDCIGYIPETKTYALNMNLAPAEHLLTKLKAKGDRRESRGNSVKVYEKCTSEGFKLIGSFVSIRRAGLFLGMSGSTIIKYINSGAIYKDRYKFSSK